MNNEIIKANTIVDSDKNIWTVDTSGDYLKVIKNYLLKQKISNDGVNKIVSNSAKILGYCPDPSDNREKSLTGLVIGKVQSGKTSNFISVAATAFDNGYNIIIILGGTKKNLLNQNSSRVQEYFKACSDNIDIFNADKDKNIITESQIRNKLKLGKKIIIVTLKHQKWINEINNSLFRNTSLSNEPVLIIDDEGDEHSLNGAYKKNKETTKYSAIKKLKKSCKRCAYLSVTATPQANIIIPKIDYLKPDFSVLIDPGYGYCGLDVFHESNSQYCVEINDDENLLLSGHATASFHKALRMFYIAAAAYHLRTGTKQKFSMLIHPCKEVNTLTEVKKLTDEIINDYLNESEDPDDISFASFKKSFYETYVEYKNSGANLPDFDLLIKSIHDEIVDSQAHLITGESNFTDQDRHFINNIYVGGDMVGRGLTFKGLVITYIIRTSKTISNVDTVLQRARWFGYQMTTKNYLDLCRVFATGKILLDFETIKTHEEDLWQSIKDYNLDGKSFKEFNAIFKLSDKLRPTRQNVGEIQKYIFERWNDEKSFIFDQDLQKKNMKIIGRLIQENDSNRIPDEKIGGSSYLIIKNLDFKEVIDKYLNQMYYADNAKLNNEFFSKLYHYVKDQNIEPVCDIVWPRYDYNNGRQIVKVDSDGTIHNYMTGRRPQVVSPDNLIYSGDRYYMLRGVIQIQIHVIQKDNGTESLALAVYIPSEYRKLVVYTNYN